MFFNIIGIYILINIIAYSGVALTALYMTFGCWLKTIKSGIGIDLDEHSDLILDSAKIKIKSNKSNINKWSIIPGKKAIHIIKLMIDSYKETVNSEEYQEKCYDMPDLEYNQIKSVISRNKFHFLNLIKEIEESLINLVPSEIIMQSISEEMPESNVKNPYIIRGEYNRDEVDYICLVTELKPTFGLINGIPYVILDAVDLEEIRECFSSFIPINIEDANPKQKMGVISMHKPNETNMSYAITSINFNRHFPKEVIDIEFKDMEEPNDSIKLTK